MTSMEEFSFIAAQLAWLEGHLRRSTEPEADSRMESALNALACARAVIAELAHIGSDGGQGRATQLADQASASALAHSG
jgi:hypothetical protein